MADRASAVRRHVVGAPDFDAAAGTAARFAGKGGDDFRAAIRVEVGQAHRVGGAAAAPGGGGGVGAAGGGGGAGAGAGEGAAAGGREGGRRGGGGRGGGWRGRG